MIIDFILAVLAGIVTQSFLVFVVVLIISALFWRTDKPFASGLVRLAFIAAGISVLFSLFGDGDDCDL